MSSFAKVTFSNDPQEYQYDLSSLDFGVNQMDLWYAIVCRTNNDFTFAKKLENWLINANTGDTYSDDVLTISIVGV